MWGKPNERETPSSAHPRPEAQRAEAHTNPAPERPAAPPMRTAQPPAPAAGAASMGKSTRVRGEIYSEEELFLDGEMEGTLEVRNRLTIGPNGKVKATIKAKEVVVRGSVQGNVEATDRIAIMNGATIVGDVKTAGIVIEDGAYFKGGIDILRPPAKEAKKQDAVVTTAAGKAQGASTP
jgi:cytoskeletal protein CcmA (bactofilin family)